MNATRKAVASFALAGALAISGMGCSSSKGGASGSFCTKLRSYSGDKSLTSGASDSASINKLKTALNDLVAAAPSSIQGDAKTVQTAFNNLIDSLATKDAAKMQAAETAMNAPAVTKATAALDAYGKNTCGVSS